MFATTLSHKKGLVNISWGKKKRMSKLIIVVYFGPRIHINIATTKLLFSQFIIITKPLKKMLVVK